MKPVAVRAIWSSQTAQTTLAERDGPRFWDTLSLSAGRLRSFNPAPTKHHFINGAQKNTVLGPMCAAAELKSDEEQTAWSAYPQDGS